MDFQFLLILHSVPDFRSKLKEKSKETDLGVKEGETTAFLLLASS